MSLENADKLISKLKTMEESMHTDIILTAVKKSDLMIQESARTLVPFRHGGLSRSILIKETVDKTQGKVTGTVYTNLDYAQYVEFGTGPVGQENHDGISPHVTPRYSQKGWMIPAQHIDASDADYYGFKPAIKNGEIIGYYTKGQAAKPFLYPAIKDNEKHVKRVMRTYVSKKLKEISDK